MESDHQHLAPGYHSEIIAVLWKLLVSERESKVRRSSASAAPALRPAKAEPVEVPLAASALAG